MPRGFAASPRLSWPPLEAFLSDRGLGPWQVPGVSGTSIWRYRQQGVPLEIGDRIAIRLDVHPCAIWGQEWLSVPIRENLLGESA